MIKFVAEIGINHNGSVEMAKELIDVSEKAGCDYVKLQKRTPNVCVPAEQKSVQKVTPWGNMTYVEYKEKIEFNQKEYDELYGYVANKPIILFASVWDKYSVDFMRQYEVPIKIPSAMINDLSLCSYARESANQLIISTGMSTEAEIDACVNACSPDVIMHTNSTYPSPVEELNLNYILWLREKYPSTEIGYSGHELGIATTIAAAVMGCTWIERHISLDTSLWGSDQSASLTPDKLQELTHSLRDITSALGQGGPRVCLPSEMEKRRTLRKH